MMKFTRYVATVMSLMLALSLMAIEPQDAVNKFAGDKALRHALVGVAVYDIDSMRTIAGNHIDLAVITASTMKTVTSTAALEYLGADFKFKTPVYLLGDTLQGRLAGNLLVVGTGDPTIGSKYFKSNPSIVSEIVEALKRCGITRIDGRIVVDESLYRFPYYNIHWDVGDLAWDYGAAVHPFNYRDNVTNVSFKIDKWGRFSDAKLTPSATGVQIINRTTMSTSHSDFNMALEYGTPAVVLTGEIKPGSHEFTVTNPLPQAAFIDELMRALASAGIAVGNDDDVLSDVPHPQRMPLVTHESPVLPEIITSLLDRSDNMFAHALLRAVAVNSKGWKGGDVDRAGIQQVTRMLDHYGCDTDALFMRDGSGLARAGRASPRMLVQMLAAVAEKRYGDVRLCDLMPKAGKRIGNLLPNTHLRSDIVLKSGSMTDVQCFVGYYPASKPRYAFAVLVNNYNCTRADLKDKIDRLLINLFDDK